MKSLTPATIAVIAGLLLLFFIILTQVAQCGGPIEKPVNPGPDPIYEETTTPVSPPSEPYVQYDNERTLPPTGGPGF